MELKFVIEAILFGAAKPMTPAELREMLVATADRSEETEPTSFKKAKADDIIAGLEQLAQEHAAGQRSFRLVCIAGAWQFVTEPAFAPWLRVMAGEKPRLPRLSQPALETLAIVAYRQPLTRAEIEQIRGVSVDGVMQTLLERGLVEQVGRAEVVGRPITFGTTHMFLEYFGLRDLDELPAADELRRVEVRKPETLQTAESGLATVPPEALADEKTANGSPPGPGDEARVAAAPGGGPQPKA